MATVHEFDFTKEEIARFATEERAVDALRLADEGLDDFPYPPFFEDMSPLLAGGYSLFPLKKWWEVKRDTDGSERLVGKTPAFSGWRTTRYTADEIADHVEQERNIGVALGDDDLVVDFDPRNSPNGRDELECFETLLGTRLDSFPRVDTGSGGAHWYMKKPSDVAVPKKLDGFPGIDFKTSGGYVVAPGSVHPSGVLYRWPFGTRPESVAAPMAPAPLLAALSAQKEHKREPNDRAPAEAKREKAQKAPRAAVASEALPERVSLDVIKQCLRQLNVLDYHKKHERWLEVVMACHSASGGSDEVRDAVHDWSLGDPYYKDKLGDFPDRWESFQDVPGGITFATLRKHLIEAGGRPPGESAAEQFSAIGGAWSDQDMTDVGNAERFAAHHADSLRYAEETKDWRKWDGRRWKPDHGLEPQALAMDTLRRMTKEAAAIEDKTERAKALAHVLSSHERRKIHAMIELARPKLRASAVDFDRDPMLLNVANGTLDLRTHELKPHAPGDHLSKVAPTDYVPGARCEVFERFLARVLPDPEVRDYFQRLMGYALQGGQEAKCFALVVGPPDAGKSTALDTIARTLGCPGADAEEAGGAISRHYVDTATVEAFGKHDGGNRPEVAKLLGVRLVLVNEIPEDGATLEGRNVKSWTGGDLVTATPKYGHPLTFKPDGLLVFMGNTLPEIDFGDDAMWERVGLVEFGVSIPEAERDRELRSKFDRRGVLAWLVEGHRQYRERGLDAPESCRLAKERRRAEADPLAEFRAAAIEPDAEGFVSSGDMWGAYQRWAAREQLGPRERLTRKKLTRALNRRSGETAGLRPTKCGGVVGWRGARIAAALRGAAAQFEGGA